MLFYLPFTHKIKQILCNYTMHDLCFRELAIYKNFNFNLQKLKKKTFM